MVLVTYCHLPKTVPESAIAKWLNDLPEGKRLSVARTLVHGDGKATVIGLRLLLHLIRKLGHEQFDLAQVEFVAGKKPVIPGGPDFNISHSGDIVLCAVSESCRVGADIEKVRPVRIAQLTRRVSSASETVGIESLEDFFSLWTKKEAVAKAAGATVAALSRVALDDERAVFDGSAWFLTRLNVPSGYIAHLARDQQQVDTELQEVEPGKLTST